MATINSSDHILLVEDSENLGYILKEYLVINGFRVTWCPDAKCALNRLETYIFHLAILDVMLPDEDGFFIAQAIKNKNEHLPVIFLTAKNMKVDKLKGFKLGADDYIVKPVEEEELLARIHAVLRRTKIDRISPMPTIIKFGRFSFNTSLRSLQYGDDAITLTEKESRLLALLLQNKNKLLSREKALKIIWEKNDYFNRRSMDVHITHLRKYLNSDERVEIRNIHGKGFMLKVEEI